MPSAANPAGVQPSVLVGVAVDVGAEGDDDAVGVGRVDGADGVVAGAEDRVAAGPFPGRRTRNGSAPRPGRCRSRAVRSSRATLTGAENVAPPSVDRASSTWLRLSVPVDRVVEVVVDDVQGAVGGGERLGVLVFVAAALRGGQPKGVAAQVAVGADQDRGRRRISP